MRLFLSPHPDDAPLSCGGTIHHLRTVENVRCAILTVSAGDPPTPLPDTPLIRELHERWQIGESPMATRREEDRRAAAALGAELVIWSFRDCIYRSDANGTPLYPGNDDYKIDVQPHDPLPRDLLGMALPYADQVTHVYAPLGVGHHVDHQVVRDWGLALANQHPHLTLMFYEDYPYAERPNATAQALGFYHEQGISLTSAPYRLRDLDVEVKLSSLHHYASQISTFWGSTAEMDERVRAYMGAAGTAEGVSYPVERYWHLRI